MIRLANLRDDALWALFQSCASGDEAQVRALLAARADLARAEYDYTPGLHFAVRQGHIAIVRFLLANGADPDYRTHPFADSMLDFARHHGHHEIADLFRHIAETRFPVSEDLAPVLKAAQTGDVEALRACLAGDPSLAMSSTDVGDTALHQAALAHHAEAVALLLDAGASVDAVRADGSRPIHCALEHVQSDTASTDAVVQLLLARGASYNIWVAAVFGDMTWVRGALTRDRSLANFEDTNHHRPLSAAARRNDVEMVRLLLDHGADPSLAEHGAPLGLALWIAVFQNQPEMVELLLRHGANPNTAPDSGGRAIIHTRDRPALRRLLLEYGAVEDASDTQRFGMMVDDNNLAGVEDMLRAKPSLAAEPEACCGEGILASPAHARRFEMMELLMRYGARVPSVTKWASEYYFKHVDVARFLLERGMDPHHRSWRSFPLLHHMAARGAIEKAGLLIDYGADLRAVDDEYHLTPLGCALRWERLDMVAFLRERGARE